MKARTLSQLDHLESHDRRSLGMREEEREEKREGRNGGDRDKVEGGRRRRGD